MTYTPDQYHADQVGAPVASLSASIAKVLLDYSPRHAWTAHPRLNPNYEPDERAAFDLGSVAHKMLLGKGRELCVIDADDWRTKAAREQRDDARTAGSIPILAGDMAEVEAMVDAARRQLLVHEEGCDAFVGGEAEKVCTWEWPGVYARMMIDYYTDGTIWDYKTTGGSANPDVWANGQLFDRGYDVQAAFYLRGAKACGLHKNPQFRFVVQENKPPYALSVVGLTPAALNMAERKVERAIVLWRECMKANRWPGYPSITAFADPPGWAEKRWIEREDREQADTELARKWLDWQAP